MLALLFLFVFPCVPLGVTCSSYRATSANREYTGCNRCFCNLKDRLVDCSLRQLQDLPIQSSLPRNTTVFKFTNNNISFVEQDYFLHFIWLKFIDGSNNTLKRPFLLPPSLLHLNLAANFLKTATGFFLNGSEYSHLRSIDLSQNQINRLASRSFFRLPTLGNLDVRYNEMETIDCGTFAYLPQLRFLQLSHNNLKELKKDQFLQLGSSVVLNLFLNSNNFSHLEEDMLDLPNLTYLILDNNQIETIDSNAFRLLPMLYYLDLSGNKISQIKNRTFQSQTNFFFIDLQNNHLSTLDGSPFRQGTFIESLNLNSNNLTCLDESFLEAVQVVNLDLSSNGLVELPASLSKQRNLYYMSCMQNKLTAIRHQPFKNLKNLKYLNFIDNDISEFENGALSDLDAITEIYLQRNSIYLLPRNAFCFKSLHGEWTKIYLQCSKTKELPIITNKTRLYCVTEATDITLATTKRSSPFLSHHGYVCHELTAGDDYVGAALCTECSVGTQPGTVINRQPMCVPCPAGGFYQDEAGQNTCKLCVPGTHVPLSESPGMRAADCKVCPEGTDKTRHASHRACFCLKNHYRMNRFGKCYPCLNPGQNCTGEHISVRRGYWMSWNTYEDTNTSRLEEEYIEFISNLKMENNNYPKNSSMKFEGFLPKIHRCPIPESCNGTDLTKPRIRKTDMCSSGYEGSLCAMCQTYYYSWFKKCYKCPAAWRTGLHIAGVAIFFVIAMLLLYVADKARRNRSKTLVDHIAAKIKILVGFGQVMSGVFQALAYIPWPTALLTFGHYMKIVELNIVVVATPSCLSSSLRLNALKAPIFAVICQAIVLLFIWIYYGLRYKVFQKFFRKTRVSVKNISLARTSCFRNTWWILFVSYPATTAQIMALLPYKPWTCIKLCLSSNPNNPVCHWLLKNDVSISCNYEDPEWKSLWVLCWSLTGYVILLPIALIVGLYLKKRKTRADLYENNQISREPDEHMITLCLAPDPFQSSLIESVQFLDENYKPKYWYWEIVEIVRKFLLTCGFQYFGQKSHSAVAFAALLANAFLLLHVYLKPIKRKSDHLLQLLSLLVILLNLMIGTLMIMSYNKESDDDAWNDSTNRAVVSIILLTVNGVFLIYLSVKFVMAVVSAWKKVKRRYTKFQLYPFLVHFVNSEEADMPDDDSGAEEFL